MITKHGYNCIVCSRPGSSGVIQASVCNKCKMQFKSKGILNNIAVGITCLEKVYGISLSDIIVKTNKPVPVTGRAILYMISSRCAYISSRNISEHLSSLNPLGKNFQSASLRHKVIQLENDYLNDEISRYRMDSAIEMYCKLMVQKHFSTREVSRTFFGEDFVEEEMSSILESLFGNGSQMSNNKIGIAVRSLRKIINDHYVYTGINTSSASRSVNDKIGDQKPSLRHALGLPVCSPRNEHPLELHQ